MFHFENQAQKLAGAAKLGRGLKGLLAAGIGVAALVGMATPASATSIFIDKAEMFTPATAYITGPSGSNYPTVYAYDGPVLFTANYGTVASATTFNFLGFCVDIFDDINVGINSPLTVNLQYHDGPLVDNGAHGGYSPVDLVTFGQTQKDEVSTLVNFGTQLWNSVGNHAAMSNTLINQLGGVQGAIWKIENPGFSVVGGPPVNGWGGATSASDVTGYITQYTSANFFQTHSVGNIDVVFDSNLPAHQAFAFAVPEPTTWGLMILGFGGVGAMLRRRRTAVALA